MGKLQFFNLRHKEMATMYDSTFTKKEAQKTGLDLAVSICDNGLVDKREALVNLSKLGEVINTAVAKLRDEIPFEKVTVLGCDFTPVNGGDLPNYKDDEVWSDLKAKLTERENLLKVALKGAELYDTEGLLVPKVSTNPKKSSITLKY